MLKLENENMGRYWNSQSLCEISLHTGLQEALSPPRHTGVQIWGGESPRLHGWRKEITPGILQDSRLNCAHVHRAFALIHEVSGAIKQPSE